jgi:hypothetical protein
MKKVLFEICCREDETPEENVQGVPACAEPKKPVSDARKMSMKAYYDNKNRILNFMPDTELRNDIIQASQHPIVFFVDRLIRQMETKTKKYTASDLFNAYKEDCSGNGINFSGNCKSFGIMFKDKLPFEQCGVVKGRSRTSMFYEIDREIMYEWLSDNNYTAFDCLPSTNELTTGTSFF